MDCTAAGLSAATGPGLPAAALSGTPTRAASGTLCMQCEVRARCLGAVVAQAGTAQLQGILQGRTLLRRGESLHGSDEAFVHVHVVRRGALQSAVRRHGGEQVVGFHFAGELVGVDGMASGRHRATATALEESELCALRFTPRPGQAAGVQAFLARLWDMMSCELVRERAHRSLLATLAPKQRVAAFQASVATRARGRRWPPVLPAEAVASYLGVDPEVANGATRAS